ncbi:hypothetical protein EOM09_05290 [bacterium]|nr:hypothetical protein [bacterium]
MKNKKFIIIISLIVFLLIIILLYLLFFKNIFSNNSNLPQNNEENLNLELEENFLNTSTLEKGDPNEGLNIEVDGFKFCRTDKKCFKNLFLECNFGNYINFMDENSTYSFSILNKYENNCMLLIQDLKNTGSENINCQIPLTEMTEDTLNKFLSLDQENINKYCK